MSLPCRVTCEAVTVAALLAGLPLLRALSRSEVPVPQDMEAGKKSLCGRKGGTSEGQWCVASASPSLAMQADPTKGCNVSQPASSQCPDS